MKGAPLSRSVKSLLLGCALAAAVAASGCGRSGPAGGAGSGGAGKLQVVAAENFWGSIAAQLAGGKISVRSIIVDPGADPHSYAPNAADARTVAGASMAIVNGLGYDNWASQLLGANPSKGRMVLNVGDALGLQPGANPHRWYFPADVHVVIGRITSDYERLDPVHAAFFARQRKLFETHALARYDGLLRQIRSGYAGVPVGYSESVFQGLGEDLGLRLLTPYSFARAIAEGTEVTARDKQAVDALLRERRIRVWVINSQNLTPDVQRVSRIAAEHRIPVATLTETLSPASSSFQQWQVTELEGLVGALRRSGGG
jgi:zinc/manganese transport system substrate-binding protein